MILYAYDSKDFLTQRSGWNLVSKIHPAKKKRKIPGGFDWVEIFPDVSSSSGKGNANACHDCGLWYRLRVRHWLRCCILLGQVQMDGRPLSFFFKLDPRKTKNKRINTWMFLSIVNIITLRLERCFFLVSKRTFWTASKLDHKKTVGSDRARTDHA